MGSMRPRSSGRELLTVRTLVENSTTTPTRFPAVCTASVFPWSTRSDFLELEIQRDGAAREQS
jgi:hypothetical protein